MNTLTKTLLALFLVVSVSACDKSADGDGAAATTETAAAETPGEATDEPTGEPAAENEGATDEVAMIEVPAAGQKFDPPVKAEQIPAGAWYCDMGTVEWAAMEKPDDGKCPVCGMMLKQKPGAAKEGAAGDGHGHDHAHDGHEGHDHAH